MIETTLEILKVVVLISFGVIVLLAGAVGTNIRRARNRESLRQPESKEAVATEIKAKKVAVFESPSAITDRDDPLYCLGARRGPEPPCQSLQGRFRG